ncbi:glycoside hydrolase family 18 and carbohydrate-binding module family 5 protein [Russula vinacea]|nr:glycoside hydrolase family 18 and carbohydrate-binding module family 5 protein [Russula vinacea]
MQKSAPNANSHVVQKRANGKVQAAYFSIWGIYDVDFQPTDIITSDLTHIIYAFADVDPSSGRFKKHFPGGPSEESGNNLYGCLKQMYLLKLAHRTLKFLQSVGGWTYSQDGHFAFVTDPTLRATFVYSAIQFIKDYGFDGIDIDFEYPNSIAQGRGFANLLTDLRMAGDALAKGNRDTTSYQLTVAVPAGSENYASLRVSQMDSALSYWNLMAYDYAGSWSSWADNQANLYGGARTNVNTHDAIKWYLSQGATASKINMGIPLYGRLFGNTAGLGQPYDEVGPGTGIYPDLVLPLSGAQVFENTTDMTSYSYDPRTRQLVSFDTPHIAALKAKYIQANGLAGSMFWEMSMDKIGSASLVGTTAGVYGNLDQTPNHIQYPNSKWDNIRNNIGQDTSSSATSTPRNTSASTFTRPLPTSSAPSSGNCIGIVVWSSSIGYSNHVACVDIDLPDSIVYEGGKRLSTLRSFADAHLWIAKWWTQGDVPGGSAEAWADDGRC